MATLLAPACSAGHKGDDTTPPKVRTDHSTTGAAAAALVDAGPAAGTLGESWHVDTRPPADSSDPQVFRRLVDGELIVGTVTGVDAYDAGTGRARWHYREPGRKVTGYAETSGSLVVMTADPDLARGSSRWTGLATATGRVRWTSARPGYQLTSGGLDVAAGQGVLPVLPVSGSGVRGVDASTGRTRWIRPVAEHGCKTPIIDQLGAQDTDGSLFALREECAGHVRVLALDPATGTVRWAHDADRRAVTVVRRGIALIDDIKGVTVVAANGHDVVAGRPCPAPCRFAVTGEHAVVTSASQALAVDLTSGKVTARPLLAPYGALAVAGDEVYGVRGHLGQGGVRLLPAALDAIDPAAGTVRTGPAPFALAEQPGDAGERAVPWIAVAGRRLYAGYSVSGLFRTTSYDTTKAGSPGELGGIPQSDWPDACAVAPGYKAASPPVTPAVSVGSVALHDLSCAYRLAGDTNASLDIAWVAPTPDDAHRLLTVDAQAQPVQVDGADEAYAYPSPPVLWFRAGRFVMRIDQTGLDARALASAAAKHLRTH
ncbi:PQQ-binding-like beta-propeller repeat protein [Actinomadura sp. DC4]|uniref:outer membrane protein assembly factor BamB family protein n=1 Tax=Actinomadura sp. DC4 TaxID=3055069 RepID=UPI0025B000FF|nr:PQQ-binding-like beta-propeller repeat protein [Actinomadura sp. DC4]MDN3351850.1 PQQ-binding-like beta-propeller repeat protein [Actinomadura sp. DC4]